MMNTTNHKITVCLVLSLSLTACDQASNEQTTKASSSAPITVQDLTPKLPKTPRTYTAEQVSQGLQVFQANCQVCHKEGGAGEVKEWQKPLEDGTYPAPPLNGTAHTWHHNSKNLLDTIDRGGIPLGGRMPAFKAVLSAQEKLAVLAYIQSLWPDEIYQVWSRNNAQ